MLRLWRKGANGNSPQAFGKVVWGLIITAAIVAIAAVAWNYGARPVSGEEWVLPVVYVVLALFLVGFLIVFTGGLTPRKVGHMIFYCYCFTWFFLIAPPLVFIGFPNAIKSETAPKSPIGIVLGCAERPIAPQVDRERRTVSRDLTWLPKEIACGNNTPQWLLNIGGTVFPATDLEKQVAARRSAFEKSSAASAAAAPAPAAPAAPAGSRSVAETTLAWSMYEELAGMPPGETLRMTDRVLGGVAVPLYFVIIAVMGGLVSMMRRVPEFQRRIGPNATNPLSCEEAREYLIFQIMQVFSAPLIAITAYYAFEPSTRAASIALAFITGFSSETILLHIRALTAKLAPEPAAKAEIMMTPASLDFGKVRNGTTSTPAVVSLRNRGQRDVVITAITATGDFQCATPATTLAAGQHLDVTVTFTPTAVGVRTGKLTIASGADGSPHVVPLSGEGI